MKPLNIDLKSPVDTNGDEFSSEPSFDKKNSLMYQGVVSNLSIQEGEGVLSTTGKVLNIKDGKLYAGNQIFDLNTNDKYKVSDSGERDIENEAVSIMGYVATTSYVEKPDGDILNRWNVPSDAKNVRVCTAHNTTKFVLTYTRDKYYVVMTQELTGYHGQTTYAFNISNLKNFEEFGKRAYAYSDPRLKLFCIGYDDDDYRKRGTFVMETPTSAPKGLIFLRGFGCIGPNGMITGEPVLTHESETLFWDGEKQGSYANDSQTNYELKKQQEACYSVVISDNGSTSVGRLISGPNVYVDPRYKVLPNGVISVWTGYNRPDKPIVTGYNNDAFTETTENALYYITEQNKALGASTTGSQTNWNASSENTSLDKRWNWKMHLSTAGISGKHFTNQSSPIWPQNFKDYRVRKRDGSIVYSSKDWSGKIRLSFCDDNSDNDMEYNYNNLPHLGFTWILGYKLGIFYEPTTTDYTYAFEAIEKGFEFSSDFIYYDNIASVGARVSKNIIGDFSYIYDSMKGSTETSDYDSVFPCLRMFFNNTNARGNYWDYGPGYVKCLYTSLNIIGTDKSLIVAQTPVGIIDGDAYYDTSQFGGYWYFTKEQYLSYIDLYRNCDNDSVYALEPLGRQFCVKNTNAIAWHQNYATNSTLQAYTDSPWATSGTSKDFDDYNSWFYWRYDEAGSGISQATPSPPLRLIKIQGDGKGLIAPYFNFFEYGSGSPLSQLNRSFPILPNRYVKPNNKLSYTNKLRLGIYSNIQTAISFGNTLLFNATDLDGKFHVINDIENDEYYVTVYVDGKSQWCKVSKSAEVKLDKMTDYMFRLNIIDDKNLLKETRNGIFNLERGFKSFLGENVPRFSNFTLKLPYETASANTNFYFASGINADLQKDEGQPGFLMPNKLLSGYIYSDESESLVKELTSDLKAFISDNLSRVQSEFRLEDSIDNYFAVSLQDTDVKYRYSCQLPENEVTTTEKYVGVQNVKSDKVDTTYYIDSSTIIYPIAISSKLLGVNYATSTVSLPGNMAVRFYRYGNDTWAVYNQNSSVYYGSNIFTIMGSNYYFDGQGVYYLGSDQGGEGNAYTDNTLIAYAIGMKYLCNAPSEAYFYSPFDRCLYIFTSSNTMQKSTSLARFGDIIDSCYCPVNQALYLLFEDCLLIKTQDDMALIDITGERLETTANGTQIVQADNKFTLHSLYMFDEKLPLEAETDWLGNDDNLSKYSYVDIVLYKCSDEPVNLNVDLLTLANEVVSSQEKQITIKPNEFKNDIYRLRLSPKEPIGNYFKIKFRTEDSIGLFNISTYMEPASVKTSANGFR